MQISILLQDFWIFALFMTVVVVVVVVVVGVVVKSLQQS